MIHVTLITIEFVHLPLALCSLLYDLRHFEDFELLNLGYFDEELQLWHHSVQVYYEIDARHLFLWNDKNFIRILVKLRTFTHFTFN